LPFVMMQASKESAEIKPSANDANRFIARWDVGLRASCATDRPQR
jgi:hypothetical protein